MNSGSRGVVVSIGDSPYNDPGSIPGSGGAVGIWVCYPCGSATSFGWDVKPRSGLRAHAFKNMRGPKRTWMTKRKSRGPETYRWCRHAQTPWKRNVAAYGRANWKLPCTYSLLGTRRTLQASKQYWNLVLCKFWGNSDVGDLLILRLGVTCSKIY